MDWVTGILTSLGLSSVGSLLLFVGVVAAVVLALYLTRKGTADKTFNLILDMAKTAVLAVEKMADNGQFEGMTPEERAQAKKEMALKFIEDSLKAVGIKPKPFLMVLAGMAIEAILKQLEKDRQVASNRA